MTSTSSQVDRSQSDRHAFIVAWGLALIFYVIQYATRSAPGVMLEDMERAFGLSAAGVSAIVGSYYYTYAIVSLIAGVALDRVGAKSVIPVGAGLFGLGCVLFVAGGPSLAYLARMLQGAGSAFAFTGAVYLAARGFVPGVLATAVGVTQSMGMLGGSAGQFLVGPLIHGGLNWQVFWVLLGLAGMAIAIGLFWMTPSVSKTEPASGGWLHLFAPYRTVLGNPQSYLCGIVAGLMFAPTTIGMMTWGVAFFQTDRGFPYQSAVLAASLVPLGWAVGCPLTGWLADRLGRRKPVVIGGAVVLLIGIGQLTFAPDLFPSPPILFLLGVASGSAMIPYTMIKEVNPDEVKGSATGAINFINFGVTSLIGPVFAARYGRTLASTDDPLGHFQHAGLFWLATVVAALLLAVLLRETGQRQAPTR